jgi:hypothetical protein
VDACSNPPAFRGVKTPITELIDGEKDTNPAQPKNRNDKDKRERRPGLQARQNTKDDRPAHEQPSAFPSGLKRPDLNATVGGRKISSETQRQLFDDIKAARCVRCHKPGHARVKCRSEPLRFEDKFDKEKLQYWVNVHKWQLKAADEKKPTVDKKSSSSTAKVASSTKAPTLVDGRMAHLPDSDEEATLHCRYSALHELSEALAQSPDDDDSGDEDLGQLPGYWASYLDESDSDSGDEDVIMTPPAPVLSTPAPLHAPDLSTEIAHFVASVAPYQPTRESEWDYIRRTLSSAPFTVLERGRVWTSILFSDGRSRVMNTADVDAFGRYVAERDAALASVSLPPRPPPAPSRTPSPLFSPAPSPAYAYRPSW